MWNRRDRSIDIAEPRLDLRKRCFRGREVHRVAFVIGHRLFRLSERVFFIAQTSVSQRHEFRRTERLRADDRVRRWFECLKGALESGFGLLRFTRPFVTVAELHPERVVRGALRFGWVDCAELPLN